ncbi:MAG: M14 family zinc carboxypeptidase [Halanaeroarchaeum sp.]
MDRRQFLKAVGVSSVGLAAIGTASADSHVDRDKYRPGGPKLGSPKSINLNAFHTNEELEKELLKIDKQSGRIELEQIGESAGLGDPLWEVQVGEGDTKVHLITQIHGDEMIGTEVALKVIKSLGTSNARQVDHILDNLSFAIIPRVNPDGAMYEYDFDDDGDDEWIGRRYNTQEWNEGDSRYRPYYHYRPSGQDPGYDMNRDFNVRPPDEFNPRTDDEEDWWYAQRYLDMPYEGHVLYASGLRLAPEIRAVTESFNDFDPDYGITHHHKGGSLYPEEENGKGNQPQKQTLMSVMAAYGPDYLDQSPFFPDDHTPISEAVNPFLDYDTSTRSIKLNSLVIEALGERGNSIFDSITRYGYYPLWGSYCDALGPNLANETATAPMLYEVAYQSDHLGQKAFGRQMELTKVGFLESFDALADDPTLGDYSVETYFDTPLFGDSITPYR